MPAPHPSPPRLDRASPQRLAPRLGPRRHLAAYKRPRMVRFVDDLPTTSTGKIMRRELIKQFDV